MKKGTFTPISDRKNRDISGHGDIPIRMTNIKKISLSMMINKALWPSNG